MKTKRYRHVVWDWNGTLLDDAACCVSVLNGMLARRGLPLITVEQYRAVFTFPVRDYYQCIGFDFQKETFEDAGREFIASYEAQRHTCALYPESRWALEQVAASGKSQSLLSAYAQNALASIVKSLGIEHFFEHLIGSDNIYALGKVAQGQRLLAALAHAPEEIVLVGDTLHDVEVATAMGVACILLTHGHQSKPRLQSAKMPLAHSFRELLTMI